MTPTAEHSDTISPRPVSPLWYYGIVGLVAAAAVVLASVLPTALVGLAVLIAILVVALVSFLARKTSTSDALAGFRGRGIGYAVALAVVFIGSLVIVWTMVRPNGSGWVAWLLGALVFVVALSGTWFARRERAS